MSIRTVSIAKSPRYTILLRESAIEILNDDDVDDDCDGDYDNDDDNDYYYCTVPLPGKIGGRCKTGKLCDDPNAKCKKRLCQCNDGFTINSTDLTCSKYHCHQLHVQQEDMQGVPVNITL